MWWGGWGSNPRPKDMSRVPLRPAPSSPALATPGLWTITPPLSGLNAAVRMTSFDDRPIDYVLIDAGETCLAINPGPRRFPPDPLLRQVALRGGKASCGYAKVRPKRKVSNGRSPPARSPVDADAPRGVRAWANPLGPSGPLVAPERRASGAGSSVNN